MRPVVRGVLALVLAIGAAHAGAGTDEGLAAFQRQDFAGAQREFSDAARAGDAKAQYLLGLGLLQGKYFERDEAQGLRWLRAASDAGSGEASFALFRYLAQDRRRPLSETVALLEQAAAQGNTMAQFTLDHVIGGRNDMLNEYAVLDTLLPAQVDPVAPNALPAARAHGKTIVEATCAACHGAGIVGAPKIGDKARWAALRAKGLPTLIDHAINGIGAHPPRGGAPHLSGNDIRDAVLFMSAP